MNFLKFFACCALALAVYAPVKAQIPCNLTLQGRVIDSDSGAPLSFASIVVLGSGMGVASDIDGNFALKGLCADTLRLRVSHIGCPDELIVIYMDGDKKLDVELHHDEAELSEVIIADDGLSRAADLTQMEVRSAALESQSGKQIAEMAALLPGVRLLQTGSNIAKPVFRGLHSNRLLLLNNGIRQEGQYWGSEHAPEIDSYMAQSVAIVEGVDALRYAPDAVGGVLLVKPPNVFDGGKLAGEVLSSLSTNGRGGSVAGALHGKLPGKIPLYYRFQGSLKKLGNVRTPSVFLTNTGIQEYNGAYAFGYKSKKWEAEVYHSIFNQEIGIYRYSHIGNLTDLFEILNGRPAPDTLGFSYDIERPRQEILHELTKFRVEHTFDSENRVELVYARQYNSRQEYDVHIGLNPDESELATPQLDYSLTSHFAEAVWHHKVGSISGELGGTGLFRGNKFRGRNFMPNYENRQIGVFLTQRMQRGAWDLRYGLRYDWYGAEIYSPVADLENPREERFDGLAGAIAGQREAWGGTLLLSLASQWRNPAVNEQFSNGLHHGAGGIEVGNPDLESERSFNATAGWKKTFGRQHIHAVGYISFIRDFIFLNPTNLELTIRGAFPRYDFAQADALYRGLDLHYEAALGRSGMASAKASLVWADNLSNGTFFVGVPAHRFDAGYRFKFMDKGKIQGAFAGVEASYTMRQYRAPDVFPFENIFGTGANTPLPESFDFALPPDGYFLLGLEFGARIGRTSLGLKLENALNNTYRDYMNRLRFFADEMGTNLTFRVKHNF